MTTSIAEFIEHLSERPWSDYTKADYSIEQWHAACLIHLHQGPPTSKSECKLPVKTPNGALNRNGVHAAAAALAGARGGVHASPEQKASAARALRGYYRQMSEEAPDSLKQSNIEEFIEHHGVKGMHWGVRKAVSSRVATEKKRRKPSTDAKKVAELSKKKPQALTNRQLEIINKRKNLERTFKGSKPPSPYGRGKKFAAEILAITGMIGTGYAFFNSPAGKATLAKGKALLDSAATRKAMQLPYEQLKLF